MHNNRLVYLSCSAVIVTLFCILLSGCAILENELLYKDFSFVYETSYPKGTMTVSSPRIYTSSENAKTEVFRAAESHCKSTGKVMIPIRFTWLPPIENSDSSMYRHMGAATLMFREMKPSDPEIKNPRLGPVNQPQTESFN